jgi:hypothetical protein
MGSNKKLTLEERIDLHRLMAEGYGVAYAQQAVKEGATYAEWEFSDDATYASYYFLGDETILIKEARESVAEAATWEAKAYSVKFPDWKNVGFDYWPADNGFAMKVRWEGRTKDATRPDGTKIEDGTEMGFYSYGFVWTNDQGEVTHWETHLNEEYSPFLEVAIGVHGPFHDPNAYVDALIRHLTAYNLL